MSTEPRRLGKYELRSRLAQGGMGEVWKAFDTQLERYVAVKLLRADLQSDPDFVTRFEREAVLVAALRHPNIVQIHDFQISMEAETNNPLAYMVMDFVEGQTLADYIRATSRKGLFPPNSDLLYIFTATSLAIGYAHQKGMVHRDIKPANILLDQRTRGARSMGEPVLTDFGIARLQGVTSSTVMGSLMGTPLYISPEQAKGQPGDHRSDLYSLGVILYEMATGTTPFRGETTIAILMQHLHDMPTPPNLINPRVSPMLSNIIMKSLSKQPDERFQSANEMTVALAQALNLPVPQALQASSPTNVLGISPDARLTLPPSMTPPGNFIPQQHAVGMQGYGEAGNNIQPTVRSRDTPDGAIWPPAISPANPISQPGLPNQGMPFVPQATSQSRSTPAGRRNIIIITVVVLFILGGIGSAVFALSTRTTSTGTTLTPVASAEVGTIQFSRSPNAIAGNFDQVQINMHNIPNPPAGRVYYAWLEAKGELEHPHWQLTVSGGNIQTGTLRYNNQNLLTAGNIFLITTEAPDPAPIFPYPTTRLYYANLDSTSTASFSVKSCPTDSSNNICSQ
jgi:eukaryotic-like serine/threonine-protein kinase